MSVEEKTGFQCDRRDFMKIAGIGAAAVGMAGMGLLQNANAAKIDQIPEVYFDADVVVIGGGIAATWAALKAKESGAKVILVDKGTVGRSGKSPWFGISCYYDPKGSSTKEEWKAVSLKGTEYIARHDYFKYFFENSKECWDTMAGWGVNKPSKIGHAGLFRDALLDAGVEIHERIMITDLIVKNGETAGVAGFPVDEDKLVVFKAKAIINCAGSGTFKGPGYAVGPLTFDGHMLGYRAGCEITGKEWGDFHTATIKEPTATWGLDFGQGLQLATMPAGHPPAIAAIGAHQGKVPQARPKPGEGEGGPDAMPAGAIIRPEGAAARSPRPEGGNARPSFDGPITMAGTTGMAEHHLDGIFPADDQFGCGIPGFFAAGDALGTAGSGLLGSGSAVSSSHGAAAGKIVGAYVKKREQIKVGAADLTDIKERIFKSRKTEQGFSPRWVQQVMQGIMIPYYVLHVKRADRLNAALTNILFIKEHFSTYLLANDAHELRLAHEVENMILNAEMKLRASLFRTESRHFHYREDIPARDDENWMAWVIIKQVDGEMKLSKRMMPKDWYPDMSISYEKRYSRRFPNELEFRKSKKI
jgi:succinate dehydrogenase/fumarate reductase flavoprotein subunit